MSIKGMLRKTNKATIVPIDKCSASEIEVMFNPNEYTISHESTYEGEMNKKQFKQYAQKEFKVSLFYDTYEAGTDVRLQTKKVIDLMYPCVNGKHTKRPPECYFLWGNFSYRGIIINIEQKFSMFLSNGVPVRSTLDITFESKETKEKFKKDQGKDACRKLWTVKSGDRLDLIANQAFKDPTQWREIAKLNKIANPFGFPTKNDFGRTLVIPDL
jgi:hypothetical protein